MFPQAKLIKTCVMDLVGTIYLAPGHRLEKAIYLIDVGKARDTKGLI